MDQPLKKTPELIIERIVSIREKVHDVIRNGILDGRITPGDRMVEIRLAKQDIQRYAFSEDQKTEKVASRGKNA
jgi:hypothetical protein